MNNMSVKERFFSEVSQNQIQVDKEWNNNCLGYNIQFVLPTDVCDQLKIVQQKILETEPNSLYCCPEDSLHIAISWILATRNNYQKPKDEWWKIIGKDCKSGLDKISTESSKFVVNFTNIVATNTAIIALAYDNGEMAKLRQKINTLLPIPIETENKAEIIHSTLFRYAKPLNNPQLLLKVIDGMQLNIPVVIDSLVIRKELIYPSLKSEPLCSVKLK